MDEPDGTRRTWHAAVEATRSPEEVAEARSAHRLAVWVGIGLLLVLVIWIAVVLVGFAG